jgi:hypothetical protein
MTELRSVLESVLDSQGWGSESDDADRLETDNLTGDLLKELSILMANISMLSMVERLDIWDISRSKV